MRPSRLRMIVCGLLLAGCGTPQLPVDQVSQSSTGDVTSSAAASAAASPETTLAATVLPSPTASTIATTAPVATGTPQPTSQPKAVQPTAAPVTAPSAAQPTALPTFVPPAQGTITITEPVNGAAISSPVTVKGSTDFWPFEATLTGRIKDAAGNQIGIGPVMVDAPDIGFGGPFDAQIEWQQPTAAQTGTLEIFEASAKDGSIVVIATVPVQLNAAP